ncbi:MAG TPA: RnfABCDGE type electron transport complex subunit B [Casimicrobiaceae bacterium]
MAPDGAPARIPDVAAPPLARGRGPAGAPQVASIDVARCIGCTLCLAACPVDAIIGAPKRLHGVLADLCSGCELCVAPCPVDCIVMQPADREWTADDVHAARARYDARAVRRACTTLRPVPADDYARRRTEAVAAALARARERRGPSRFSGTR